MVRDFNLKGIMITSGIFNYDNQITFYPTFAKDAKLGTPFKRFTSGVSVFLSSLFDMVGWHHSALMMQ